MPTPLDTVIQGNLFTMMNFFRHFYAPFGMEFNGDHTEVIFSYDYDSSSNDSAWQVAVSLVADEVRCSEVLDENTDDDSEYISLHYALTSDTLPDFLERAKKYQGIL